MCLSGHALVSIVKIQPELLGNLNQTAHIFGNEAHETYASFKKYILHQVQKLFPPIQPDHDYANGVEGKIAQGKMLGGR
jgi:hypothetical protein